MPPQADALPAASAVEPIGRFRLGHRPECPAALLSVLAAVAIVLLNNSKLFSLIAGRIDPASVAGLACLLTAFLALIGMLVLAFLLLGFPYVLKPVIVATFLLSSVLSYCTREWGTVFDHEMIRNIVETFADGNRREAQELLSFSFGVRVLAVGVIPSVLVGITRVVYRPWKRELALRARTAGALAFLFAAVSLSNFRTLAYFSRENHEVRCYATPTFALNSLCKYVKSTWTGGRAPFLELGGDARQRHSGRSRTVGVFVVGETARADHFSLNDYARDTNPRLGARRIVNFPDARAGGTSTAFSVPFMFSFLGKREFTIKRAAGQSNVLDVLVKAGVKVVWIDNNSGSKGVGDRIGVIEVGSDGDNYDEGLVGLLERHLDSTTSDLLIVLHTMGSHGPAYSKRYPPAFERFTPASKESSPQDSPREEVVNAYDNSILYTDHVLDRLIAVLERRPDTDAAFLVYASDHGESLGENGIYLHGLPDFLAPEAQTRIPMLAWLSPRFLADRRLEDARLQEKSRARVSHSNLPHTILGLFDVSTSLYQADLDLLRGD